MSRPSIIYYITLLLTTAWLVSADDGCYSSVDTSVSQGIQQYGTQSSCSQSCGANYPFIAMKDGGDCYCLSALPGSSSQTSTSQCSVKCNGYGSAMCGGTNAYTVFDNLNYSGSAAGSSLSPQSSSKTSSSSSSSSPSSTSTHSSNNGGTSSTSPTETQSETTSHVTASPSETSSTVSYRTVTATSGSSSSSTSSSTSSPTSSPTGKPKNSKKSSTNIAPIVGGVVGGVAALVIIAGLAFFIRRRNSREDDDEEDFFKKGSAGSTGSGGVARAKSSKINSVFDMPMANPFEHPSDDFAEKRASTPANGELTDPRLNPVMMGRRRLSEGSLADEADYSRKILGVANP